jgi:hypothetical protein
MIRFYDWKRARDFCKKEFRYSFAGVNLDADTLNWCAEQFGVDALARLTDGDAVYLDPTMRWIWCSTALDEKTIFFRNHIDAMLFKLKWIGA